MVCISPVGFDVELTFRALVLRRSSLFLITSLLLWRRKENRSQLKECHILTEMFSFK